MTAPVQHDCVGALLVRGGRVLLLDGASQYVELHNSVNDFKDTAITVWAKWLGGAADQRVWSMVAMRKPDTTNFLQGMYLQDKASNAVWFYGVEPTGNTVFGHGSGITETAAITAAYLSYMLAITSAGFVGIGTNAPNAKLDVRGGICLPTKPITVSDTPYTVLATDYTIRCNCVGGAITVALPEATGTGRILNIKQTDSSANAVTVDGYSTNTIDGETTQSISSQYDNMQIQDAAAGAWDIL